MKPVWRLEKHGVFKSCTVKGWKFIHPDPDNPGLSMGV